MKTAKLFDPARVLLEVGSESLRLLDGEQFQEWPLERDADGALTPACRAALVSAIPAALGRKPWQPSRRAWCALPGRGISLRRFHFPAAATPDLVRLQVEAEFPVGPEELAWGWMSCGARGSAGAQTVTVAAVRSDVITPWAELLVECGLKPSFTVAAVARALDVSRRMSASALLSVAAGGSELTVWDDVGPRSIRVFPWGERTASPPADGAAGAERAADAWMATLHRCGVAGGILLVEREVAQGSDLAGWLESRLGMGTRCLPVVRDGEGGPPSALRALRAIERSGNEGQLPWLELHQAAVETPLAGRVPRRWAVLAAMLLAAVLAMPTLEAVLFKPQLARRVAAVKAERPRLDMIEREFAFLRHLQQNQAPYSDALWVLSKTAPRGPQFESISMNRRGELVLRGSVRNSQEVVDFRTKLVESGFFATVVVEEQTPSPDRQKVAYRLRAEWKPGGSGRGLPILADDEKEQASGPPGAGGPGMP